MKNVLLLIVFLFPVAMVAENIDSVLQKQMDSSRHAILKPRIDSYLAQANVLTGKIRNTDNKDSLRVFSKQLQRLTDSLICIADAVYGFSSDYSIHSGIGIDPVTAQPVFVSFPVRSTAGTRPPVRDALLVISDKAENVRFFHNRKAIQLEKIEEAFAQLETY